jgi:hypothetical protein
MHVPRGVAEGPPLAAAVAVAVPYAVHSWQGPPRSINSLPRSAAPMCYDAAADLVVVVHMLFIGFVMGGAFVRLAVALDHFGASPAVVYGALVEFAGFTCPSRGWRTTCGFRRGRFCSTAGE